MFKKVESILSRSRKVCTTIAITAGVGLGVYYGGKHVIKKLKEKMNPLHAVHTMLEEFEEENRCIFDLKWESVDPIFIRACSACYRSSYHECI